MLVCWYFLYLSNKLRMIMIVARIRIMKNRTEDTTMRDEVNEDSELFVAVVLLLVVDALVLVCDSDVMGANVVFRMFFGGKVGSAS